MIPQTSFRMTPPATRSPDRRSTIHIKCSKCPKELIIHRNARSALPTDAVRRMASRKGWSTGKTRDQDICPACNGTENKKVVVMNSDNPNNDAQSIENRRNLPDDIDMAIFERLDDMKTQLSSLRKDCDDISASHTLMLEVTSDMDSRMTKISDNQTMLYENQLRVFDELRAISETMKAMVAIINDDYDGEIIAPIIEHGDDINSSNDDARISYGDKGLTRRLTPVEKITITSLDDTGIKIRFSREVWDEAGMPVHEGCRVVVEPKDDLMLVRVPHEGEKGILVSRINAQSVHLQTNRFTAERSSYHPAIKEIHPGSILVDAF